MIKHLTIFLLFCGFCTTLSAQGDCAITNLTVTPLGACDNGMFFVSVDFDITNPEGDVFGIVGNATNYGFFMYEDLPVILGPLAGDGETDWQFIVYDLGEPNCQATYNLGIIDCCSISDVVIDQVMCTGTSTFRARLDLSHSNTGNVGFEVYSSTGALLGSFLYANLPVIVLNIPSFRIGTTHITLCDIGNSNCCTVFEFNDPDCNKTDCEIYNLTLDTSSCDDGDFFVSLDFDVMLGGPNFTVTGNGNNYGTFSYTALPITIGPLEGDSTTVYEFVVDGAGTGNNCLVSIELGTVACPPGCGFNQVEIETLECRGEDAYSLSVDFVPITPGTQGFSVYAEGVLLGSFDYNSLPITIDSFPATGDFFDELVLCDNADTSCCYTYEFRALLCCCCVINQIEVTPTVCDDNDQFYVEIDFYHFNEGDEGFQIGGTGGLQGPFSYDSLPIVLGPFNGDSVTYYEFLVFDGDDAFCFDGGELGIIDCDCGFESLSVDTLECTGNGFYSVSLDFTPIQVTDDSFEVYAGDEFLGYYAYDDLPVTIDEFPASGNIQDTITVCDFETPTCCITQVFTAKDCFCGITNISAQTSLCDTQATTFDLYLDFDWDGVVSEFSVFLGSNLVGTIQGVNLPDTLFGLATNIGTSVLTICGNGHPDCCASTEIVNPCQGPCEITGLTVSASDCDSLTNTFSLTFDFNWIGDYEEFEVFIDDVSYGFYTGSDLPETISNLTTFGGLTVVTVVAQDRPDCFASVEILLDECRTIPCDISDLLVAPGQCTSASTFSLIATFAYEGFTEDSVDLWTDNLFLGRFHADSLPIAINDFPWNGADTMSLTVCQSGDLACCETIEFAVPYCGCDILSITALPLGYCNPDAVTFPVSVDVDWLGDISTFTVYAGTELLAVLNATQLPDTVLTFPVPLVGELAEITMCGNDDSTCCATVSFIPPNCDTSLCVISNITVDTFQCTGASTFSAWVNYQIEGFEGPIQLFANGMFLGEYPQILPLLLINIPESVDPIELRICNAENLTCCADTTFAGMHCADAVCTISDATAIVSSLDSVTGLFDVEVNFEFENIGPAFTVSGNGNQYGVFTYDMLPLTISDLQCDSTTSWAFLVQDLQNIGCLDFVSIGVIACDTVISSFVDPAKARPLEILYGRTEAYFVVPERAEDLKVWTYDGRLIGKDEVLQPGELFSLSAFIPVPGFYFVQVSSRESMYIGKVVKF